MPDHVLIGPPGSDVPAAIECGGRRAGAAPTPDERVLAVFPAHSWDAAVQLYLRCREAGIEQVLGRRHGASHIGEWWTFSGSPGYLTRAAMRLGVSTAAISRAEGEETVKAISTPLGECYARYRAVRGPTKAHRDFTEVELRDVRGLIAQAEGKVDRLFAMADAGRAMVDDARDAFGLPPGGRRHTIADAAAVAVAAEPEADRLRSEHAELLAQNRQLAAMIEQLTAPTPTPAPAHADDPPPSPASDTETKPAPPRNRGR